MDLPEDGLSDSDLTAILDSIAPSNAPTVKDELERKTGDALDWLISRYKQGQMSAEACSAAADAIFMAVSGLVGGQLMEVVTAMGSWLPSNKKEKLARIFSKDGRLLMVTWKTGETHLTFFNPDGAISKRDNESVGQACAMFAMLEKVLGKAGYVEVDA